jgi:hypothetical protein
VSCVLKIGSSVNLGRYVDDELARVNLTNGDRIGSQDNFIPLSLFPSLAFIQLYISLVSTNAIMETEQELKKTALPVRLVSVEVS